MPLSKFRETAIAALIVSLAIAVDIPKTSALSLVQKDLFFRRNISKEQFQTFVDNFITPRFPAGLTIFHARDTIEESSELVTLFIEDTPANKTNIEEIVTAYSQQFGRESVLEVSNTNELKVGFNADQNLIDNDRIPETIGVNLFFGCNISGGKQVSQEQFQTFVDKVIKPRFPAGLTIFDTDGQFKHKKGNLVKERSKIVTLLLEDTVENEKAIDEIVKAYMKQFNQESVLIAVNEDIKVSLDPSEDAIDNDRIPEKIQADLFFKKVSNAQFQAFVDKVIKPHFPTGTTIFDATSGTEQLKVVRLLFEDTVENENAIDEIIKTYMQQFDRENFLLVVDENIEVNDRDRVLDRK